MEITKKDDYRKLVRVDNTIFMYAPIGSEEVWDNEEGTMKIGISDSDFIAAMNEIEADNQDPISIRINSAGGSTKHGAAIMTRIRSAKNSVHTYNDGTAASMAAAIWAMGDLRFMSTNALLMLHHPWDMCIGNAQQMRDCADVLDKITESMILGLAEAMGKTPEDVRSLYFSEYKDIYLTYTEVKEQGLIADEAYDSGIKADSTAMAQLVRDPFAAYRTMPELTAAVPDHKRNPGFFNQLAQMIAGILPGDKTAASPIHSPTTDTKMFKDELITSLKEGKLTAADVNEALAATAPPPDPQAQLLEKLTAMEAKMAAMHSALETAQATIKEIGAQPGASRSQPGEPDADLPDPVAGPITDPKALLKEKNKAISAAVADGKKVRFKEGY